MTGSMFPEINRTKRESYCGSWLHERLHKPRSYFSSSILSTERFGKHFSEFFPLNASRTIMFPIMRDQEPNDFPNHDNAGDCSIDNLITASCPSHAQQLYRDEELILITPQQLLRNSSNENNKENENCNKEESNVGLVLKGSDDIHELESRQINLGGNCFPGIDEIFRSSPQGNQPNFSFDNSNKFCTPKKDQQTSSYSHSPPPLARYNDADLGRSFPFVNSSMESLNNIALLPRRSRMTDESTSYGSESRILNFEGSYDKAFQSFQDDESRCQFDSCMYHTPRKMDCSIQSSSPPTLVPCNCESAGQSITNVSGKLQIPLLE